jgi:hypothetical protein
MPGNMLQLYLHEHASELHQLCGRQLCLWLPVPKLVSQQYSAIEPILFVTYLYFFAALRRLFQFQMPTMRQSLLLGQQLSMHSPSFFLNCPIGHFSDSRTLSLPDRNRNDNNHFLLPEVQLSQNVRATLHLLSRGSLLVFKPCPMDHPVPPLEHEHNLSLAHIKCCQCSCCHSISLCAAQYLAAHLLVLQNRL